MSEEVKETKEDIKLPYTLKLKYPIELKDGEVIPELVFSNRLTASDLMEFPCQPGNLEFQHLIKLIPKMTLVALPVIKKLDAQDTREAVEVVGNFL